MAQYEIIEHTADVGIAAEAPDLPELFRQMALGLADIMGAWKPDVADTEPIEIVLDSNDLGGLLVDWLNEIIWLQDSRDAVLAHVRVTYIEPGYMKAKLGLAPRAEQLEGTAVKAITYHRLLVEQHGSGWRARVYVDV